MRQRKTKRAAATLAASLLLGAAGCASPGPPRPPSLRLPRIVRNLQAMRQGDTVALQWTAPEDTTDGQPLWRKHAAEPMTATVCRVEAKHCTDVATMPVAPGAAYSAVDRLPPALTAGEARAVGYRIRVRNGLGRDAGVSREVLAVAGTAPAPIQGLAATTVAAGIQLTWQKVRGGGGVRVEATTEGPNTAARPAARLLQVGTNAEAAAQAGADPGGAIDSSPATGARVTYHVYRRRVLLVHGAELSLQGEAAEVTATRSTDVFPPAAPTGLLAQAFATEREGASASLSWEPNGEADVAGYLVYRAGLSGEFVRVTPQPVRGVSWNHTAATGFVAGQHFRYAVTAVDRAGNESPRSAMVDVESR